MNLQLIIHYRPDSPACDVRSERCPLALPPSTGTASRCAGVPRPPLVLAYERRLASRLINVGQAPVHLPLEVRLVQFRGGRPGIAHPPSFHSPERLPKSWSKSSSNSSSLASLPGVAVGPQAFGPPARHFMCFSGTRPRGRRPMWPRRNPCAPLRPGGR